MSKSDNTLRDAKFHRLLEDLIEQLQDDRRTGSNLDYLDVRFFTKRGRLLTDELSVTKALDCLVNDVHIFEDFDLEDADSLEVFCR